MPGIRDEDLRSAEGALAGYRDVPLPDADASVDPHWLQLRGRSDLPTTYLPPAMSGERAPWLRAVAVLLVALFVGATAIGVCLTYGPPLVGW